MDVKTKHLSLLIKPASSLCGLRCRYCFYHDIAGNRNTGSYGIMKKETSDILIEKAVSGAVESILFAFQGGEPSLAGLGYFKYFAESVKREISKSGAKLKIDYSIQTNGVNITEEFAVFFKEHGFLVGLSLDGTKETNDYFRGEDTYKSIIQTAKLFDKIGVDYNILTVVTAQTAKHIEKIYNFYKTQNFMYLQFIPCLAPLGDMPFSEHYSLTPELYERFLINLFRLWHADFKAGKYISIRFFDNLARIAAGQPPEQCGTTGFCAGQFVIEADGSVFPCDFYCVDNWNTGNIRESTFEELYGSPNMKKFRDTSFYADYSEEEREKCGSCKVFYLCRGGCRRDRDNKKDGFAGGNIYCGALYGFYAFAEPYLKEIAKTMRI
jgi:uncharacterized protein